MADAEAVGYAMFSSWEIREHKVGHRSGNRSRCNRKYGSRSHVRANLWVNSWEARRNWEAGRSWVTGIREAVWRKTVRGCRILVR